MQKQPVSVAITTKSIKNVQFLVGPGRALTALDKGANIGAEIVGCDVRIPAAWRYWDVILRHALFAIPSTRAHGLGTDSDECSCNEHGY